MNCCNNEYSTAELQYHGKLSDQLRSIEKNITAMIVTVISSTVPFIAPLVFNKTSNYLPYSTFIALLIIFFGHLYLTSVSYTYRHLMIVMISIEKKMRLDYHTPNWKLTKQCFWSFYPENIKAQIISLELLALFIAIIGNVNTHIVFVGMNSLLIMILRNNVITIIQIIVSALILVLVVNNYYNKLLKRQKEVKENNKLLKHY